jgi:hypothetical protein
MGKSCHEEISHASFLILSINAITLRGRQATLVQMKGVAARLQGSSRM